MQGPYPQRQCRRSLTCNLGLSTSDSSGFVGSLNPSSHGADLGRIRCWIQLKEHLDSFLTQGSLHVRPLWLSCGAPDQRSYSTKDLIFPIATAYEWRQTIGNICRSSINEPHGGGVQGGRIVSLSTVVLWTLADLRKDHIRWSTLLSDHSRIRPYFGVCGSGTAAQVCENDISRLARP